MKISAYSVLLLMAACAAARGQTFSIGVKGGVPLLDSTPNHDESRPYVVGPSVEIRLPAGFAIEADALYQRIGSSFSFGSSLLSGVNLLTPGGTGQGPFFSSFRSRGNSWEFPILGKYYFRPRTSGWQPFLDTGISFRTAGFHSDATATAVDASGTPHTSFFHDDSRSGVGVGAVVGAGVRFHTWRLALSPEFRYTRRGGSNEPIRRNEAGLLLGISF